MPPPKPAWPGAAARNPPCSRPYAAAPPAMLPGCSAQMADRDRPAQLTSSEIISEIGNQSYFRIPRRRQEGLLGGGMPLPPTWAFAGALVATIASFFTHRGLLSTFFRTSRLRDLLSRFCVSVASVIIYQCRCRRPESHRSTRTL